jgi:hypothetical protein
VNTAAQHAATKRSRINDIGEPACKREETVANLQATKDEQGLSSNEKRKIKALDPEH